MALLISTKAIALLGLLLVSMMAKNVQAKSLTFIELSLGCTNNTNGLLLSSIWLSQSCNSGGPLSTDNGCKSGTFNSYNSTNCSGDISYSIPTDTCANLSSDSTKGIYRCLSHNDPEYLRTVLFIATDVHGPDSTCQSPFSVVSFTRLGICYPGTEAGALGSIYEKANATAYRVTEYNDAACNSVNRTWEGNADGNACVNSARMDFVDANLLSNSATLVGRSTGLIAIVGFLAAALVL